MKSETKIKINLKYNLETLIENPTIQIILFLFSSSNA
jgi:hypothetical protein